VSRAKIGTQALTLTARDDNVLLDTVHSNFRLIEV
jgi:hypothetical protein